MSKVCENCGAELLDEATSCHACGKEVATEHALNLVPQEQSQVHVEGGQIPQVHVEGGQSPQVHVEGGQSPQVHTEGGQIPQVHAESGQSTPVHAEGGQSSSIVTTMFCDRIERMSILKFMLYSCCTLGIYSFFWWAKLVNTVHTLVGRRTTASGGTAVFYIMITCGIYGIYLMCKLTDALNEAMDQRDIKDSRVSTILAILFPIFVLIPAVNRIIDFDYSRGVRYLSYR